MDRKHGVTGRVASRRQCLGLKRVTRCAISEKIRRWLRKVSFRLAGAAFRLASSIQNVHSAAGTVISALAKISALSLSLMPLIWSGWKCETTI